MTHSLGQRTFALAGNPNSGKSTLINALTQSNEAVGNWSGVTVDMNQSQFHYHEHQINLLDLPGLYSLINVQREQATDIRIAQQVLLEQPVDGIINVIDATQIERHLYLTSQLLTLGLPMIVVITMLDLAKKQGISLDLNVLSVRLGCPIFPVNALKKQGLLPLKAELATGNLPQSTAPELVLPKIVKQAEQSIAKLLNHQPSVSPPSWLSRHLLSGDIILQGQQSQVIQTGVTDTLLEIKTETGEDADILIADAYYQMIHDLSVQVIKKERPARQAITHQLDRWLLHKYLGIPLFLFVIYSMFVFAIHIGGAFQDFFGQLSELVFLDMMSHGLATLNVTVFWQTLIARGVGLGINTTLTFVPVLGAMYLFLSFLESSGYLARASVVMDRAMRTLGLPGKAFVPLIIGFGCNVPAVLAARTLTSWRDRVLTVLMIPFMSCGARLAIFAVFVRAFFPQGGANVVFSLYLLGIIVAILTAWLLRKTLLRGEVVESVQELPPYRWPQGKFIAEQTWRRLKSFVWRAGKLIIPVCLVLTLLQSVTWRGSVTHQQDQTILASIGRQVTPLFAPLGVTSDNWPATVGLITGILAKEVVVGTLNTLYSQQTIEKPLSPDRWLKKWRSALATIPSAFRALPTSVMHPIQKTQTVDANEFSSTAYGQLEKHFSGPISAYAYLLFVLLYFPCISTMSVMSKESSRGWCTFSLFWSACLAYGVSTIFYQLATFSSHPQKALAWIFGVFAVWFLIVFSMRSIANRSILQ